MSKTRIVSITDPEGLTPDEIKVFFDALIAFIKKFRNEIDEKVARNKEGLGEDVARAYGTLKETEARLSAGLAENKKITQSEVRTITRLLGDEVKRLEAMIPELPDLIALQSEIEQKIPSLPEELKAEQVRDKLESLEGDNRLDKKAIKGLDEWLEKEMRRGQGIIYGGGGGGSGGGRIVKGYDLSDSLDGSTKTFALPAFYRVISVHTSSFPFILKPTTDYTTDAATMEITFTSEIDAATTLATGQTITIIY